MSEFDYRVWDHTDGKMKKVVAIDNSEVFGVLAEGETAYIGFEDATLMQYTGIKDCKGKKIYEGDVFDVVDEIDNGLYTETSHENCVVFFSEEWAGFCYGTKDHEVYDRLIELEDLAVIGNIYEDLKLMK